MCDASCHCSKWHRPSRHFFRKHRPPGVVQARVWPRLEGRDACAAPHDNSVRCLQLQRILGERKRIDAMKRVLMLALLRGAAPLLAPRHAVRSFARRPAPKKRPSVSMALCVAASRKRIEDPVASRYRRLRREHTASAEMPHADAIDARVDDTVSTQARATRRAEARTSYTTTS